MMPDWVRSGPPRNKYINHYYTRDSKTSVHRQFARLVTLKNANKYSRFLTGAFFDAPWTAGVLSTIAAISQERVDVPPAAFDFFRANPEEPSLEPLQLTRVAPRIAVSVYKFIFKQALDFLYHSGHKRSWLLLDDSRKCLQRQFKETNVQNGNMSFGTGKAGWDLLAHMLSLAPSFKAYMESLYSDVYLEGLEGFSTEKLFFIYYAINYCESNDPAFFAKMLLSETETPAWHKVNGALRNFQTFSDIFECSLGSFMNPVNKCTWTFR